MGCLFQRQAREVDRKKREALLHEIQKILHERVEGALTLIPAFPYSAPCEDLRLKRQ